MNHFIKTERPNEKILLLSLFCLLWLAGMSWAAPIKVTGGQVEGTVEDGLQVYRGIPFAAPPVGKLRWAAPQPVKPWDGVLKTDRYAPACYQFSGAIPMIYVPAIEVSEDCLYLNVLTPAQPARDKLPVMVWIHGGGFFGGASFYDLYSGEHFAKRGMVYVSISYRLGKFGFLAHPELTAEAPYHTSGNYGLLDQIAALQWVKDNITAFGGDPGNVTIFGESAGGVSVSMLAGSPLATGLFQRAISQSGGALGPPGENTGEVLTLADSEKGGVEFMKKLGSKSLADLRALPAAKIFEASANGWPVMDGYVIPDDLYRRYEQGRYNDVPVLIGTNSDEGGLFSRPQTPEQYQNGIRARFGKYADTILKLYPGDTPEQAARAGGDIMRDTTFAWPTWAWAQLQSRTGESKVYMYFFDQPQPPGTPMASDGALHGSEMPFMFQHLEQRPFPWRPEDYKLAEMMVDYWTNFAKTGDPNGAGLPKWPVFQDGKPTVMHLRDTPKAIPVPRLNLLRTLDDYFSWRRSQ